MENDNRLLRTLCLFRGVLANRASTPFRRASDSSFSAVSAFADVFAASERTATDALESYARLFSAVVLDNADCDLTSAIERAANCDDNVFTQASARRTNIAAHIEQAARRDLEILRAVATTSATELKTMIAARFPAEAEIAARLPEYRTHASVLTPDSVRAYCAANGVGLFSRAHGFVFTSEEGLTPVTATDPIRLSNLKNYEEQRKEVLDNTIAFLNGLPAQNVLLYGDRGTGKSSTVKAILNEYGDRGLRMIELNKSSIDGLEKLIGAIHLFPMKFIIFIDDLSFNEGDNNFGLLKAALEGSLVTRPDNILIYATSNRRHLIKETFSSREGNEVHRADTLDEAVSLSDRFGLTVTFSKPNRAEYLDIVHQLAAEYGISAQDWTDVDLGAEQWAMLAGGRSPRVAKQFVRSLISDRASRSE